MYNELVMDHMLNPRNVGELADADGAGEARSASCGDVMKLYLAIDDGVITDVRFQTYGCGAAIASSSIATELIRGKTLDEAWYLSTHDVVNALGGLPEAKEHCSVLAEDAIRAAINDYLARNGLPARETAAGTCSDCCRHDDGSCPGPEKR
ncbi:iron-sulfur cluster assembly scaffold protein [Methanoculleus frigidifontis]|nr:iron-sulfur cluster assembly scaffold protein [Methanoculleus sp. FWC-SCC1]